ncbi:unnamed protein product [Arctia plantaginis]|uniref:4-nitrophenylphosphatase n=1 Tax=Arctia plantaginis TaxID=874455 RepID=A0A8S1AXI2_ARCPL|nr:unnamed protein product [Arctia plantaginis]
MESTPVDVTNISPEEFQNFLNSFDHVFSDCDGVVWRFRALPRVGEFFDLMKKHGKTVHFASNNSMRSQENYEAKFKDAKIENGFQHLITPSVAIAEYLKTANFNKKKKIYAVSCEQTIKVLESYGYSCKKGPDVGYENFEDHIEYLQDDPEIGAVVVDNDLNANLAKIQRAVTYLKKPDVLFLGGATDRYVYHKQGCSALDCGIFTEIIAAESHRDPIILGKPGKLYAESAMRKEGVTDASRVLFIGDLIDQDVGLGKAAGFKTLMVLSSISKEEMLAHKIRPDYYADSLASIVPFL